MLAYARLLRAASAGVASHLLTGTAPPFSHVGRGYCSADVWLRRRRRLALFAAALPFLLNLARCASRRIFAIAKLSFKEASRAASCTSSPSCCWSSCSAAGSSRTKPEDQVRTYVSVVYWAMTPLLLFTAGLLAAFSIPADIRSRPSTPSSPSRSSASRSSSVGSSASRPDDAGAVGDDQREPALRAARRRPGRRRGEPQGPRAAVRRADVSRTRPASSKGDNVGREWDYRSYITAPRRRGKRRRRRLDLSAVCRRARRPRPGPLRVQLRHLPHDQGRRRTAASPARSPSRPGQLRPHADLESYRKKPRPERRKPKRQPERRESTTSWPRSSAIFEVAGKDVTDFHTLYVDVPGGLFRNALQAADQAGDAALHGARSSAESRRSTSAWPSTTSISGWTTRAAAASVWLRLNFFKGGVGSVVPAGAGDRPGGGAEHLPERRHQSAVDAAALRRRCCVRTSSARSAPGTNVGGGPLESLYRLATRQITGAPLESRRRRDGRPSRSDVVFRWVIRRVLDLIPDVDRFDLTALRRRGLQHPGSGSCASACAAGRLPVPVGRAGVLPDEVARDRVVDIDCLAASLRRVSDRRMRSPKAHG